MALASRQERLNLRADMAHDQEVEEFDTDSGPLLRPLVTYGLCLMCVAVFVMQNLWGTKTGLAFPGLVSGWEITEGAYWGLLTSFFLHGDLIHIGFNLYMLYWFGSALEPYIGWLRFLIFWVLATAVGSYFQIMLSGETGVGASGFVYALFGLVWIGRRTEPYLRQVADQTMVTWLLIWFVLCIVLTYTGVKPIANGAHFGGLLFGAVCGYAFINRQDEAASWLRTAVIGGTVILLLSLLYAPWSSAWNLGRGLKAYDQKKNEEALYYLERTHLSAYGEYVLELRASLLIKLKRPEELAMFYRKLVEMPGLTIEEAAQWENAYAWLLATSTDAKVLNAPEAIRYATMACQKTSYGNEAYLDTLAAAYAADGQFAKAIEWQQKALAAKPSAGNLPELQEHLRLYQQGKAYKEALSPK